MSKKEEVILDGLEKIVNKIVEEQMLDLLEKYPSMKLKEDELRKNMKEELKKMFLLMKENPDLDKLEPDEKTLNEVISKIPLIYNETVLMYNFICDYIEKNKIEYNYYDSFKEFNKTINEIKNDEDLKLESLFYGSNILGEVILKATNSLEETKVFQDFSNSLDKYMKGNELMDSTKFILEIVKNYPSLMEMKIHKYLGFN